MWTDIKSKLAMGLQVTSSKRKLEVEFDKKEKDHYFSCSPIKTLKWSGEAKIPTNTIGETVVENSIAKLEEVAAAPCETWNSSESVVDCISKLEAVAVPTDPWGGISTKSTLATSLLSTEEIDDEEDDFEDDYEEEENIIPTYCPLRYPLPPQRNYSPHGFTKPSIYSDSFPQKNCSRTGNQSIRPTNFNWNSQNGSYYVPGETSYPQQTIRCAENGKSYLELGSSSFSTGLDAVHSKRCCDGRGTWCNTKNCYKEIRLKIRNLSLFKLSRFRQVSEQSLYRSVLICNTLKKIDSEIECEGKDSSTGINLDYSSSLGCPRIPSSPSLGVNNLRIPPTPSLGANNQVMQHQHHFSSTSSSDPRDCSSIYSHMNNVKFSSIPFNSAQCSNEILHPYDHYPFRDSQSGRATPFPIPVSTADSDSGYGDDDGNRSINWSSVLSLSSQSALDPLNNNDLFSTLPSTHSPATTAISATFTASSVSNPLVQSPTTGISSWDYGFLDMDLGLGPELTELVPSCKISSEELFKTVSPSINSSRYVHENELESPAHIMVGS